MVLLKNLIRRRIARNIHVSIPVSIREGEAQVPQVIGQVVFIERLSVVKRYPPFGVIDRLQRSVVILNASCVFPSTPCRRSCRLDLRQKFGGSPYFESGGEGDARFGAEGDCGAAGYPPGREDFIALVSARGNGASRRILDKTRRRWKSASPAGRMAGVPRQIALSQRDLALSEGDAPPSQ